MPEQATLQIHQPPSHENMSTTNYEKMVATELACREQQIADEMRVKGQTFMGIDAVMKQSHSDRSTSREPRRKLNPRFASLNKLLRISAIKRYRQFVCDYMRAREAFKAGDRDAVFPFGTVALRIHLGVNVAPG